jgi:hypothetical protein
MQVFRALSRSQWLLIITVFRSVYGVGQVWLVQLSSYHLWAFVVRVTPSPTTWNGGAASGMC